jgi:hypothetical protein
MTRLDALFKLQSCTHFFTVMVVAIAIAIAINHGVSKNANSEGSDARD